jgi:hypothetical protein
MENKIKLKGIKAHGRLYLSGIGKYKRKIPSFFEIIIDLDKIKKREKSK